MRILLTAVALVCFTLLLSTGANFAGDKKEPKETVLKGKITCAKCDLGVATECATVIVVKGKDKDKDVTYYFDKKADGKYHANVCSSPMEGTVTGTVKDADKKKVITVTKVEFDK